MYKRYLRVTINDNDFIMHVFNACDELINLSSGGHKGEAFLKRFYEINNITTRLKYSILGHVITFRSSLGRVENIGLNQFESTFEYIESNLKVEFVDDIQEWDIFGETAYIDLHTKEVNYC